MKFDMGQAWNEATRLLLANSQLVLIVAGVFFFLPYFALMIFLPGELAALQSPGAQADPEKMVEMLMAFYAKNWWLFLLIMLTQAVGMIGLMSLLTDRARPTLGQALQTGVKYLPTYIGVQLLQSLLLLLVIALPIMVGGVTGVAALAVVLGIAGVIGAIYLFTKFSLSTPIIAIERVGNPINAMRNSWRLTKGNSVKIFLFYLLLGIALVVVGTILTMIAGLIFALMGAQVALVGNGLVSALVNATYVTIFAAVLAAIRNQLSGPSADVLNETFD